MSDIRVRVLASGPLDAQQRGLALAPRYGMDPDRVVRVEEIPESRSRRTRSALWEVDIRGTSDRDALTSVTWAPTGPLCWMCGRAGGSPHTADCPFEGIVETDR